MGRLASTLRHLLRARRQARIPFRPIEEIRSEGNRRVRSAIRHAVESVPFYRDALEGVDPAGFRTVEDLARLPLVTPADYQRRPEAFLSTRYDATATLEVVSAGSTAEPRTLRHDPDSILSNAVHGERERSIVARIVGRSTGYREAVVAPELASVHTVQAFVRDRLWLPPPLGVRRRYGSMFDPPAENAARVAEFRPHVIHSYGSYLGPLLRAMLENDLVPDELRVATYSSDPMPEADRRFVVEELGVPVLSTYQAVEAFKIGFECEEGGGLHLNVDLYPVRIVDDAGRPAAEGETGSVVVSNLVNRATVLLNYRLGDRAAFLPGPCPCGRTLPRMSFPEGREDDWVEGPDGRRAHSRAVSGLIVDEMEVRAFQVVQRAPGHFEVRVVAAAGADREALEARLRERFAERFGDAVVVEPKWVDALERSPGGKVRAVVRR